MNLESQVCALELAKRLKELGVKQESLHWWSTCHECNESCGSIEWELKDFPDRIRHPKSENYSAFTVAELGEMLPREIASYKHFGQWRCCRFDLPLQQDFIEDTEADARAKMLIHLLENGLMERPK